MQLIFQKSYYLIAVGQTSSIFLLNPLFDFHFLDSSYLGQFPLMHRELKYQLINRQVLNHLFCYQIVDPEKQITLNLNLNWLLFGTFLVLNIHGDRYQQKFDKL